jgi:hypothetical protein
MRAHVTLYLQSCTVPLRKTATSLVVKSAARVQIDTTVGCDVQGLVALQPTSHIECAQPSSMHFKTFG